LLIVSLLKFRKQPVDAQPGNQHRHKAAVCQAVLRIGLSEIIPKSAPEPPQKVGIAGSALMPGELLARFRETLAVQWVDVENTVSGLRVVGS